MVTAVLSPAGSYHSRCQLNDAPPPTSASPNAHKPEAAQFESVLDLTRSANRHRAEFRCFREEANVDSNLKANDLAFAPGCILNGMNTMQVGSPGRTRTRNAIDRITRYDSIAALPSVLDKMSHLFTRLVTCNSSSSRSGTV